MTDLGTLGGFLSMHRAINNAGQVLGDSYTARPIVSMHFSGRTAA